MNNQEQHIFIDQAGYLPEMEKKAVITTAADSFDVISADTGETVFSAATEYFGQDEASGDDVYIADLSAVRSEGLYRIKTADGELSHPFRIARNVYSECFGDVCKAFYFLRCGCGLDEAHAGAFRHGICHAEKALEWDNRAVSVDVRGGWHDAGDYGRYVTAGACALAHLLYAYRFYSEVFDRQSLNIPESGGVLPDILAECRVELNWILKMQREDGAVYHKATTKGHAPFIMPEDDTEQMFVLPPSSIATADAAAVLALASGIFAEFEPDYSEVLLSAALKSYRWLEQNPDYIFENRTECTTGGYGERTDRDNRFWAAAELYSLTGEDKYHDMLLSLMEEDFSLTALGYADIGGLGAIAYILSGRGDEAVTEKLINGFVSEAQRLADIADKCGYGAAMLPEYYHWGSNMSLLKHAMTFLIADRLTGSKNYERYAAAQLHYLLGCNATGYSYVSGTGERSINYPHLRPTAADSIDLCIPGMVSGGANRGRNDPDAKRLIPDGTPPMKCFVDDEKCYSLNEITIYWNSPAVFLLAHFNGRV